MSADTEKRFSRLDIHPIVFGVSAGLAVIFVAYGAIWTEHASETLGSVLTFVTDTFGWLFIGSVAVFLLFCLYMIIGSPAKVRLGPDDSRPDYSYLTWFAMLFSAGMGIGLLFFGVAEPMWHYTGAFDPPPGFEESNIEAARSAMLWTYHHWGLGPWAVYAVLGLSLAYFGFRHGLPLTVRSAFYPLIGDRIYGPIGNVVDILAVLGTLVGVAVSLGLGAMQVNAGLEYVFGIEQATGIQVLIIVGITAAATISVVSGLDKGIRWLSQINITLAAVLLLFVALVGPTLLLLTAYFENLGNYVQNFVQVLFVAGAYGEEETSAFLGSWTVFYWAWWISWAPFVGMFIARISRGRTIREFTLGVLLVPSLVSFLWFTVMGNTALDIEETGGGGVAEAMLESGQETALFAMLDQFPLSTLTALVAMVVVVLFFVTSSDSGSFVVDILTSGGNPDPPVPTRVFWAVSEGVVAAVLLVAGGAAALSGLQAGAVATGLPFALVLLFVVVGLLKGLRSEAAGKRLEDLPNESLMSPPESEPAEPAGEGAAQGEWGEPDSGQPKG